MNVQITRVKNICEETKDFVVRVGVLIFGVEFIHTFLGYLVKL